MALFAKKKSTVTKNTVSTPEKVVYNNRNKKSNDIAKLEEKIDNEKDEMEGVYTQIGKLYYELHRNDVDEKMLPLCNVIKESNRIIDLCEKQILFLQGIKLCPRCGAQLTLDSLFCNKCGERILDGNEEEASVVNSNDSKLKEKEVTVEFKKCRECGSDNPIDTIFCTNCGAKIG